MCMMVFFGGFPVAIVRETDTHIRTRTHGETQGKEGSKSEGNARERKVRGKFCDDSQL